MPPSVKKKLTEIGGGAILSGLGQRKDHVSLGHCVSKVRK